MGDDVQGDGILTPTAMMTTGRRSWLTSGCSFGPPPTPPDQVDVVNTAPPSSSCSPAAMVMSFSSDRGTQRRRCRTPLTIFRTTILHVSSNRRRLARDILSWKSVFIFSIVQSLIERVALLKQGVHLRHKKVHVSQRRKFLEVHVVSLRDAGDLGPAIWGRR